MKVAVIGSGNIGAGLGRAWAKAGHVMVFGAREPNEPRLVALCAEVHATARALGDAATDADVVVLAVPFKVLDEVLDALGDLAGKVVIDCTNAVEPGMTGLKFGPTTSAAEELQKKLPRAHVFKSFNAQGAENLERPVYDDMPATNFFCGDDDASKTVVKQLVEQVGFDAIDVGPLRSARLLEPMMLLWIACAKSLGTRDIAFRLLRRS